MKLNVMGTTYQIDKVPFQSDPAFAVDHVAGYCDVVLHRIVYCDLDTDPNFAKQSKEWRRQTEREVLRHEIVHAFLAESGLQENAAVCTEAWPTNEEMIDWFALKGPQVYAAWKAVGAVEEAGKE